MATYDSKTGRYKGEGGKFVSAKNLSTSEKAWAKTKSGANRLASGAGRVASPVGGAIKDIAKDEMYGAFGTLGQKLKKRVEKDSEKIKDAKDTSKKIKDEKDTSKNGSSSGGADGSKPMAQAIKSQAQSITSIDGKLEDIVLSQRSIQQDVNRILFMLNDFKGLSGGSTGQESYQEPGQGQNRSEKKGILDYLLDAIGGDTPDKPKQKGKGRPRPNRPGSVRPGTPRPGVPSGATPKPSVTGGALNAVRGALFNPITAGMAGASAIGAGAIMGSAALGDYVESQMGTKEKIKEREGTEEYKELQKTQQQAAEKAQNRTVNAPERRQLIENALKKNGLTQKDVASFKDNVITLKDGRQIKIDDGQFIDNTRGLTTPRNLPTESFDTGMGESGEQLNQAPKPTFAKYTPSERKTNEGYMEYDLRIRSERLRFDGEELKRLGKEAGLDVSGEVSGTKEANIFTSVSANGKKVDLYDQLSPEDKKLVDSIRAFRASMQGDATAIKKGAEPATPGVSKNTSSEEYDATKAQKPAAIPSMARTGSDTTTGQTTSTEKAMSAEEAQRQGGDVEVNAKSYDLESKGPVDFTSDKEITFESKSSHTIIFKSPHIKFETDHLEFVYKKKTEGEQGAPASKSNNEGGGGATPNTGAKSADVGVRKTPSAGGTGAAPSGTTTPSAGGGAPTTGTGATAAKGATPQIKEIAQYIYSKAAQMGVDPDLAIGIAAYEGLNRNTISSPTFGNKDARGYSFGPYQLFSGSPDPETIAKGGMAHEFLSKYKEPPNASNWKQQVDFSLELMKRKGPAGLERGPWYAVRDRGGVAAITKLGAQYAAQLGLKKVDASIAQPSAEQSAAPGPQSAGAGASAQPDASRAQQAAGQSSALGAAAPSAPAAPDASRAQQAAGQSAAVGQQAMPSAPSTGAAPDASRAQQGAGQSSALGQETSRPTGGNGKLPANMLVTVGGNHKLQKPAAEAYMKMVEAAKKDGITWGITDSYRTYDAQVDVARRKGLYSQGGLAARPGTSNHGWGTALDLGGGANARGSKQNNWLMENAHKFGFSTIPREPWHWEFKGGGVEKPTSTPGSEGSGAGKTETAGGASGTPGTAGGPAGGATGATPGMGGMGGIPGMPPALGGTGGMGGSGGSPLGMIGGMLGGAIGGAKGGMVGGLAGNLLGGILSSVMAPRTTTGSEIDQRSTQRSVEREKRDKKIGNVQTTAPTPSNSRPNTPQSSTPSGPVHPSPQLLAILDAEYGSQPAIVRNISQQHSGLGRRAAPSVA